MSHGTPGEHPRIICRGATWLRISIAVAGFAVTACDPGSPQERQASVGGLPTVSAEPMTASASQGPDPSAIGSPAACAPPSPTVNSAHPGPTSSETAQAAPATPNPAALPQQDPPTAESTRPDAGITAGPMAAASTEPDAGSAGLGGAGTDSGASGGGAPSMGGGLPMLQPAAERVSFGTTLDAAEVMSAARQLAQAASDPERDGWRATGDQHRVYHFDETNEDEPYRLYVPTGWDGESKLPLVMFLHGAGSDENTYVDQNGHQLLELAEQHGFLLVSPMGVSGAYGNFLRLSAPFGEPEAAAELMAQVTEESLRANELSEMDVINVLELVLAEYPIEYTSMFLTGHSMGSGGTWYIGGKYSTYWRALAPMSGPFVQESGYPWDNLRDVALFVSEGTQTPSRESSVLLADWLATHAFQARYIEVNADHGGMVPLVLPDVFSFFAEPGTP
jgi:poly(3-hydroxybutyrate) depolymerase